MNIWAFPSFYPYDYPGMRWAGTFAHRQYKGLIQNGANLNVILPVLWNPPFPLSELFADWKKMRLLNYPHKRVYDGITIYHPRIANMKPNRIMNKTYAERYTDAIANFFKDNNIVLDPEKDIFYGQWLPECVLMLKAARKLGVKCAVLGIGDDVIKWPREGVKKMEEFKELVTNADVVLTNADYLGKDMQTTLAMNVPYIVNYFGIDYDKFKPVSVATKEALKAKYNIPVNKTIILTVGSPIKRKGWLDLFDALLEIKKENANFVLVGGYAGPKDIDIPAEIAQRDLKDQFFDQGEINPEVLNEFYNIADIFCLPSHWEGLATVVSEAMASGLPVITTNVCGQPEIIRHGVTGILIEPKDPLNLRKELQSLIEDQNKREQLGSDARKFIVETWGNDNESSGKLYRILDSVL